MIARPVGPMTLPLYRIDRRALFTTVKGKTRGLEMFMDTPAEEEVIYTHRREILTPELIKTALASTSISSSMVFSRGIRRYDVLGRLGDF